MDAYSSILSLVYGAPYVLLIPIYIVLSPLCIISSSLFEAALGVSFDIDEQTTLIILVLLLIWSISALYIIQLIRNRSYKSIFFYQFVFYLSCFNSLLAKFEQFERSKNEQNLLKKVNFQLNNALVTFGNDEKLHITVSNGQ